VLNLVYAADTVAYFQEKPRF